MNSPDKNIGMDSHALLQGIVPTQGFNPDLLHCRRIVYCLNHQGNTCLLLGLFPSIFILLQLLWYIYIYSWTCAKDYEFLFSLCLYLHFESVLFTTSNKFFRNMTTFIILPLSSKSSVDPIFLWIKSFLFEEFYITHKPPNSSLLFVFWWSSTHFSKFAH